MTARRRLWLFVTLAVWLATCSAADNEQDPLGAGGLRSGGVGLLAWTGAVLELLNQPAPPEPPPPYTLRADSVYRELQTGALVIQKSAAPGQDVRVSIRADSDLLSFSPASFVFTPEGPLEFRTQVRTRASWSADTRR